jgi:hypothetical protein
MRFEKTLDRIHSKVTKNALLQLFTSFTRVLLAVGFIPPSIPKIMYRPFTTLPVSDPVGHYFNALFQTGFYYQFIGWSQIFAAVLLLIPRTSHLGALMFFPIIINITVLTNSVGFTGTWLITTFMSLAALYLVCWDYDRWKSILFFERPERSTVLGYEIVWLPLLAAFGGVAHYITLAYFLFETIDRIDFVILAMLAGGGLGLGLLIALHHRFMRVGNLEISDEKL